MKLPAVIIKTAYPNLKKDKNLTKFYENGVVLFKKNIIIENYFIKGPAPYNIKKQKFKAIFKKLI